MKNKMARSHRGAGHMTRVSDIFSCQKGVQILGGRMKAEIILSQRRKV